MNRGQVVNWCSKMDWTDRKYGYLHSFNDHRVPQINPIAPWRQLPNNLKSLQVLHMYPKILWYHNLHSKLYVIVLGLHKISLFTTGTNIVFQLYKFFLGWGHKYFIQDILFLLKYEMIPTNFPGSEMRLPSFISIVLSALLLQRIGWNLIGTRLWANIKDQNWSKFWI